MGACRCRHAIPFVLALLFAAANLVPAARAATAAVPLDRVLVVVNDEAITQWDLNEGRRILISQMKASNVTPPSNDVLDKQVLERLIVERAVLQYAKETGIRVDDTTVERTILRVAEENKLSPEEFRKVLEREGIPYANYREDIRRQIIIQRVREREVDSKVTVSDAEVDNYLATIASQAGGEDEYLLSHIYITVPDQASPDAIEASRRRAAEALAEVKSGKDFAAVAASYSNAPDATCRTNCTLQRCGDSILDNLKSEQCDLGASNSDRKSVV